MLGGIIFEYFGGIVRYIYGSIYRTLLNKKKYTFKEYLYGPKDSDDFFDNYGHGFVNRIIGLISLVLIASLIIKSGL